MTKTLIPLFADQLSHELSSLVISNPENSIILMMEVEAETKTVPHHRKKLIFLFSAMRHFAKELEESGWAVDYVRLNNPENTGSFASEIERAVDRHDISQIRVCEPSEHRVMDMIMGWEKHLSLPITITPDYRFLATHGEFNAWAEGRKQYRMEFFYREMRKKTGLLMDGDAPVGGKWNFDSENRKTAKGDLFMPTPLSFEPDSITQEVLKMVMEHYPDRFGSADGFNFAVTRAQAKEALGHFVKNALPFFGDYQDAMLSGEPFLYHSLLSMYLNVGLVAPLEVCEAVEEAYRKGKVPLNAAEGYIRQIIGWREYIRGIYWLKMPGYTEENALGASRALPDFYWTGETDMHCMSEAIGQTVKYAYAHHIQRLMITGNFALLIGVDPKQIHEWYLAVYVDAFEWVELPNTLGMSQYADGGLLSSKPYASSGAYINRMSNYCKSCKFDVKEKLGDSACPFNSLYWHFISRNENKLSANNRMSLAYRNLRKMDEAYLKLLLAQAEDFLSRLESAEKKYF